MVIVNFHGWRDTVTCLESVLRSECRPLQVYVVDNGSTDDSMQNMMAWARGELQVDPGVPGSLRSLVAPPLTKPVEHVVLEAGDLPASAPAAPLVFIRSRENLGFAGGNNVALRFLVRSARDGYFCLLNNDTVVAPAALGALRRTASAQPRTAVGGVILDFRETSVAQSAGGGYLSRLGMSRLHGAGARLEHLTVPTALDYLSGGLLLAPVALLRDVGFMDESYFLYGEDADWCARMRRGGWRFATTLQAIVWHRGSQTTGVGTPFQDYYVTRSALLYVRRTSPGLVPLAVAHAVARFLLPKVVRGEWRRARAVAKAGFHFLQGRLGPGPRPADLN